MKYVYWKLNWSGVNTKEVETNTDTTNAVSLFTCFKTKKLLNKVALAIGFFLVDL